MAEPAASQSIDARLSAVAPNLPPSRHAEEIDHRLLATGIPPLDAVIAGLALGRTHALIGGDGSGATLLLHHLLAAVTREHPVLLLDPHARFHPPSALAAGVHLPHLLWARGIPHEWIGRALSLALREAACPLVVWDADIVPPALLDRVRPLVHRGRVALLVAVPPLPSVPDMAVDGVTIAMQRRAWGMPGDHRPGCRGSTLTVAITDHQRGSTATVVCPLLFLCPLPPLVRLAGEGGERDGRAPRRGDPDTGPSLAVRRAG